MRAHDVASVTSVHPLLASASASATMFVSRRSFFFNDTATTEIYTLSLHDALPISRAVPRARVPVGTTTVDMRSRHVRSEEHTSELQSRPHLVCRLLLEKKKNP